MKKSMRYIVSLLVLLLALSLCACGQTGGANGSGELDLDYVGEDAATEEEAPWYTWITDAFSFGKKETKDTTAKTAPDSVEEYYSQGTEAQNSKKDAQTASPTETEAEQPSNTTKPNKTEKPEDTQPTTPDEPAQDNTPTPTQPESKKNTVTITIRCDTAVNNGMHLESKWSGIVPASGVILPVTTVEIEEGDTVFDVLSYVCSKYKIHMEYSGGTSSGCYVEGINNLYEFDGGRWSGWMYCVNDWYPNYGCGVYFVKAGEVIEWNYTCDLGCDLENGDPYGYGKDWKDNHD